MDPAQAYSPDELRFDKADVTPARSGPLACHVCQRPLHDVYFEVDCQPSCEKCRYELADWRNHGSGAGRFMRALVAGGLAGLVGAGVYYAVLAFTGYEVGLVAIVVGFLVGFGVRWGSRGRGGWPYQVLAVGITYVAIVSTYVPFIFEEIQKMEARQVQGERPVGAASTDGLETPVAASTATLENPAVAAPVDASETALVEDEMTLGGALVGLALFGAFVLAIPFLGGFENIVGLAIIGFGLYQAWKINTYTPLLIEGPFQVGKAVPVLPTPASIEPDAT